MHKRDNLIRGYAILLALAGMFILLASIVFSEPIGPDSLNVTSTSRYTNQSDPAIIQAQAGNVSSLKVSQTRVTESWQGYFGNVTGTIVLNDANNHTFYDWSLPSPTGEIYASNGSNVVWTGIYCINVSPLRPSNGTQVGAIFYAANGTQIELNFGINSTDADGLNETFNGTFDGSFEVGDITIDGTDGCSEAHPYRDTAWAEYWDEVLLTDNTSLIFTSIIREDGDSYQNSDATADFQILVLENGHTVQAQTATNYYFFVELT